MDPTPRKSLEFSSLVTFSLGTVFSPFGWSVSISSLMFTSPTVNKLLQLACGRAGAPVSCSSSSSGAQGMPRAVGTWAGMCLVWQVGQEVLTQCPFLLATSHCSWLPAFSGSVLLQFFLPASSASSC